MLKKTFLFALAALFVVAGAGLAAAANSVNNLPGSQVNGMVANDGGMLPTGLGEHVNPGGLGDALLFGYYNVRADGINQMRIVNTSDTTAIKARVRFNEGRMTQEILDFNLCLSAGDEWTLFIIDSDGVGGIVKDDDDTTTHPAISDDFDNPTLFRYEGGLGLEGVTMEDTLEGHLEILATVAKADAAHVGWTADECQDNFYVLDSASAFDAPNSLLGTMAIVPGTFDQSYGYNATALANCNINDDVPVSFNAPFIENCAAPANAGVNTGLDAVEYVLTKSNLYVPYNALYASAEAVITFPTKNRRHVADIVPGITPVDNVLFDSDSLGSLCDIAFSGYAGSDRPGYDSLLDDVAEQIVTYSIWDDEENEFTASGCDFSPCPPATVEVVCNDTNVIKVGSSDILDTGLEVPGGFAVPGGWEYGWFKMDLALEANHQTTITDGAGGSWTANGLPVIGYILEDLIDADIHLESMNPIFYDVAVDILGN